MIRMYGNAFINRLCVGYTDTALEAHSRMLSVGSLDVNFNGLFHRLMKMQKSRK